MRPTAVVAGALANKPGNGGNAWSRLQWALGLRALGFDVVFVEQIAPEACVDRCGAPADFAQSVNRAYFRSVCARFGLAGGAALVCGDRYEGLDRAELERRTAASAVLVNIGGHLALETVKRAARRRVFFDDDPGYTQLWQAQGLAAKRLEGHDVYFTVGANVGADGCSLPTGGIHWRPARPPVVLDQWPRAPAEPGRFTTVASWRGAYGTVGDGRQAYGPKAHEFRHLANLPRRAGLAFEVALDIHPADDKDVDLLRQGGWKVVEPRRVAGDPDAYRHYVRGSGAECSAAQAVYVHTGSGWFSDRTACYLASGRPALVQDTGQGRDLPTGEGLVTFRSSEEAAREAGRIVRDYPTHAAAARALAEAYFDSAKVVADVLDQAGVS